MLKKHLAAGDKSTLALDTIVEGRGRGFYQIRPNMDIKSVQEKLAGEKREGWRGPARTAVFSLDELENTEFVLSNGKDCLDT